MKHEKIFKRDDGTRVKVKVEMVADHFQQAASWRYTVLFCPPKKRTFYAVISDDYTWRRMDHNERNTMHRSACLIYATPIEIESVMLELWEQAKPDFSTASYLGF